MLLSLQEGIWRTAATLTLTYFVGWGLNLSGSCRAAGGYLAGINIFYDFWTQSSRGELLILRSIIFAKQTFYDVR